MSDPARSDEAGAVLAGVIAADRGLVNYDDPATMAELGAIRDGIVQPALQAHGAELGESSEADILIRAGSAAEALACGLAIQEAMVARNVARETRRLHFQFGVALHSAGGAARAEAIAALAGEDEVWADADVATAARGHTAAEPGDCGTREIGVESLHLFRFSPDAPLGTPAPPPPPPAPILVRALLSQGVILNGTYQIDSLIAQGGMGEVFKGHEVHSNGIVAVKLLRTDMSSNKVALALFQKEAQILKEISHDAIVRYFLFSFDATLQRHYLAMEFVDGISLAEMLKRGPLGYEDVCTLRHRIASALFVAHERGIIHRDMSPDNIIIPGGSVARAKVIDFGIARAAEIGGGTLIGGGFAGKYNYVSPEQLGLAGGEITPKSDIYSLGLVLAECSLGKPIDMSGSQAEVIEKRRKVPDLSAADKRLRPLLEQMLQPDPGKRPASMAAIADWPTPGVTTRKVGAGPGASDPEQRNPKPRRPWPLLVGAGALALLIAVGGIGWRQKWFGADKHPAPDVPHDASIGPASNPPSPTTTAKDDTGASSGAAPATPQASPPQAAPQQPSAQPAAPKPPIPPPSMPDAAGPGPSIPPSQPAEAGAGPDAAMTSFVTDYAAASCFVVKPVQITLKSALVEAFALTRDDFATFDHAFSTKFGFSPDIAGYRVWSRQCAALDFMRQVGSHDAKGPYLLLTSTRVGSGKPIAGEIRNTGDRVVTLLIVHEDGTVTNASGQLKPNGDARTFDLANGPRTSPVPQLLVAITSQRPLSALSGNDPLDADKQFPAILAQARSEDQTLNVDAKLFLLGG